MSEAQASLQRIIEAAPLAIALLDARTLRVLQLNQVAARPRRRTPAQQLIGRDAGGDASTPASAAALRADMAAARWPRAR